MEKKTSEGTPYITVIIPAYNEERTIEPTLKAIEKAFQEINHYEVIVIDDGSLDRTPQILKRVAPDVAVITHHQNRGYGASLLSGVKIAKGEIVIFLDADLSYDPSGIKRLVNVIEEGQADLVIGSRFLESSRKSQRIPFYKVLANKLRTLIRYFTTGAKVTDSQSVFRAIRKDKFEQMSLTSLGSSINSEMVEKALKRGFRIAEVPIFYREWRGF